MWEGYGETPDQYMASGRDHMTRMLEILSAAGTSPEAFEKVLDFGCAAGRMLRFYPESPGTSERWGMDLKASTISWCQQNMSPPFLFATNTTAPQLPFEDNYFDFVYAGSVFTHIADLPDAWFLELRRILRKNGYLYLTIHDRNSIEVLFSQFGDRNNANWFVNMLRRFDAETKVLSQDYGCFSFEGGRWGGFPVPQVFYDVEWLVRKWSSFAKVVSITLEAYGHQTHRDIAAGPGLHLRPLPVDGMGAVVGRAAGADAVLLTPAHQFPLGVTLHPRRRREVADWGGVVIEDDYDGEFRYDRQPVGALQTLAPDHVIYAGTASKSLAPSLRLGWLVVPPRLLDAVAAELAAGPSVIDQLTLAEFITSGGYDRQIRRARLAYRRRRDRLAAALRRQGLRVTGIAAGMHAVLELPRTSLEHAALSGASEHGVAIDGLGHYRAGGTSPDDDGHRVRAGLVIGYGRPPEHAYTTALARLCAVLADLR